MAFEATLNDQAASDSVEVFSGISLGRLMGGFFKKVASMIGTFFKTLWVRMLDKLRASLGMSPKSPPPKTPNSSGMGFDVSNQPPYSGCQ